MSARYALYFSPDDQSELALFGQAVIGRCATAPRLADASSSFKDHARWQSLTQSPAHYGFHATLKAPFELQHPKNVDQLLESVESFVRCHTAVPLTGLAPRRLSSFAALTLRAQPDSLTELAQSIVETFEPFRQALSHEDVERRKSQPLTTRQLTLLDTFGYPYVADEFRFHMTLSGVLNEQDSDYVAWLEEQYQQRVNHEPMLDRIAVFTQPDRQSAFVQAASFKLQA